MCLTRLHWAQCFESIDPGVTLLPIEHREPFLDLRVLTYLLAIPPMPWCDNKEVLRSAMAGLLPELVRRRPKTPLAGDPTREVLHREESLWVDRFEAVPELGEYVVRERIPRLLAEPDSNSILSNLRPLSLNCWLSNRNDPIISWRQPVEERAASLIGRLRLPCDKQGPVFRKLRVRDISPRRPGG